MKLFMYIGSDGQVTILGNSGCVAKFPISLPDKRRSQAIKALEIMEVGQWIYVGDDVVIRVEKSLRLNDIKLAD